MIILLVCFSMVPARRYVRIASRASASDGEPLTPADRLFVQKETDQVVHYVMGTKRTIDVVAAKASIKGSVLVEHPRFCSILVRDSRGIERWRRTEIEIDRHFVVVDEPINGSSGDDDDNESSVNEYLADLSISSGLSTDKPLWEFHILKAHNCVIWRIHHSLGDGTSLMSMFLAMYGKKAGDPDAGSLPCPATPSVKQIRRGYQGYIFWWETLQKVWYTIPFAFEFVLRSKGVRDLENPIRGGDGVELWPRKLATARFSLEDMKLAKRVVPNATINDVLFGILSSGLYRYLGLKHPNSLCYRLQLTGVAIVSLRERPGLLDLADMMTKNPGLRWGNLFGIFLVPLYYRKNKDPLEHLRQAKKMLDRKKNSLEAQLAYWIGYLVMSIFGAELASVLNKSILCNTTFTISNIVGPQDEIALSGNPITYMRATCSSLPNALTMHLVSYAGRADLQISVAKDIIPDPEFLAKCFEDALSEIKQAALSQ